MRRHLEVQTTEFMERIRTTEARLSSQHRELEYKSHTLTGVMEKMQLEHAIEAQRLTENWLMASEETLATRNRNESKFVGLSE